ncbi:MAG: chemotaxis response regulator protein-glutamate methylesterase [Pseudomonadota bacterium]
MNKNGKIKVLIIDDSAVMRQMLTAMLNEDPEIEVVGTAANPLIARDKIKTLKPDVLTLDVEMPGMDGITFLEKLMRLHPLPVVMVSSLTKSGAAATLRALDLGAVDFVTKPQKAGRETMADEFMDEIRTKVRAAATAHVHPVPVPAPMRTVIPGAPSLTTANKHGVIAIGASAGGTQAITDVLARLPVETPGIVIVQHMPPKFTTSFAERLNSLCALEVREAKDGERVTPGVALLAPGGYQMALWRDNGGYAVKVYEGEKVNLHRPSVNVLFDSVARCKGVRSLGIILTGMGSDGAQGLCAMKMAGAHTIAQDEKSCVVYGMPGEAVRLRGVSEILPLEQIAGRIVTWASGETTRA